MASHDSRGWRPFAFLKVRKLDVKQKKWRKLKLGENWCIGDRRIKHTSLFTHCDLNVKQVCRRPWEFFKPSRNTVSGMRT